VAAPAFTLANANGLNQLQGKDAGSQTLATQVAKKAKAAAIVVEVAELVSAP
jgi:hypothetical protein